MALSGCNFELAESLQDEFHQSALFLTPHTAVLCRRHRSTPLGVVALAFAINGRKPDEEAGAGVGVEVFNDGNR